MRTIDKKTLKEILVSHRKWLIGDPEGKRADFSGADLSGAIGFKFKPIQIVNTKFYITILDNSIFWGCRKFTFDEFNSLSISDCQSELDEEEFNLNKKIIIDLISFYRK